jgi:hypothetical protein
VLDSKADSAVSVEQFQRASVTSLEDLLIANGKAVITNGDYGTKGCKISDEDILNLNKVKLLNIKTNREQLKKAFGSLALVLRHRRPRCWVYNNHGLFFNIVQLVQIWIELAFCLGSMAKIAEAFL